MLVRIAAVERAEMRTYEDCTQCAEEPLVHRHTGVFLVHEVENKKRFDLHVVSFGLITAS